MAATGLHISISAEPVFTLGGLVISNSMLTSLIVSGLLIAFAVLVRMNLSTKHKPTGLQNVAEWIIEMLNSLIHGVTGSSKRTRIFFPLIATFFLYILLNNWLGLFPGVGTIGFIEDPTKVTFLPSQVELEASQAYAATTAPADDHIETVGTEPVVGEILDIQEEVPGDHGPEKKYVPYFRAGTADLNTTIALATISVFMTQVFGFQFLKLGYFGKFINFSSPIGFFVGILETVLEFAKIISFAFRLFGNIFAGEVLLAVISFLAPIIAPMPFYGLEVIVGVIQALVFAMLSVVFFNMATIGHDDH